VLLLPWSVLENLALIAPEPLSYLLSQEWLWEEKYSLLPAHPHYQERSLPPCSWKEVCLAVERANFDIPHDRVVLDYWSRLWWLENQLQLPSCQLLIDQFHLTYPPEETEKIHLLYLSQEGDLIEAHVFPEGLVFHQIVLEEVAHCYRWLACPCCPMEELICLTSSSELHYIFRSSPYYEIPYTSHAASLGYLPPSDSSWKIEIAQDFQRKTIQASSSGKVRQAHLVYLVSGEIITHKLQ
jgi:hypothetical protein